MRKIILFSLILFTAACQNTSQQNTKTEMTTKVEKSNAIVEKLGSRQIMVVKTANFETIQGKMQAFEWTESGKWQALTEEIDVVVGGKGLAWGSGLHEASFNQSPLKKEGDKKSPAGLFYLSSLFGYLPQSELGVLKMPYMQADKNLFCVDDGKSQYYNQIVSTKNVVKDWESAENMLMERNLYKYGVVVDYNFPNPEVGRGSCIFVHIWQDNQHGTAGCTAMMEDKMQSLIHLLDKSKRPILVQCTEGDYESLKKVYGLP